MVKEFISFVEMKDCIDKMVELCITDNKYQPYMKEFAVRYTALKYFTDYSDKDKSVEEIYSDLYSSEWVSRFNDVISNCAQFDAIIEAFEERIAAQKELEKKSVISRAIDVLLTNDSIMDFLVDALSSISENVNDDTAVNTEITE